MIVRLAPLPLFLAVGCVLAGGSRHEGGAQSSGQSITATGGNSVAVNDGGLLGFYELVRDRHPQAGETASGNNSVDHESQGVWERDTSMDRRSVRARLDADGRGLGGVARRSARWLEVRALCVLSP